MSTDVVARNAKPSEKAYKIPFGNGLYLYVTPSGGRLWRFDYRFDGRRKTLSFGPYPDVSLIDARERRDDAKKSLRNDTDPGANTKAAKTEQREKKAAEDTAVTNTFEAVACRWFEMWQSKVVSKSAVARWSLLRRHVFPALGVLPIADANNAKTVKATLREMENKGKGIGNAVLKAKNAISMILDYAIEEEELIEANHIRGMRFEFKNYKPKHYPCLTDPKRVGGLMRAIDGYREQQPQVKFALRLLPLVFCRPGELRAAKWADIDLDAATWSYTVSKTREGHIVPLSRQALEILHGVHAFTGGGELVFPGRGGQDTLIANNTFNTALRKMGYDTKTEHCAHGFRGTACTMLSERLKKPIDWIERQLSHRVPGALGDTYNRTQFLDDRREMMQAWADYLDELKRGAKVIPIRANQ